MTTWIRVKGRVGGHEFSIPEQNFDPAEHKRLDRPAHRNGKPLPPKPHRAIQRATERPSTQPAAPQEEPGS